MKTRIILSFKTTETTLPATELSSHNLEFSTSIDSEPNISRINNTLHMMFEIQIAKEVFAYERQMSNFQNIKQKI
jgi:hypothetical protein